ncbi:MAG: hypothetical protein Fur009_7990 [Candidatus Microgenomates bacterium]
MGQTITLPKSTFDEILKRLYRLEEIVFGKKIDSEKEYIRLSKKAKLRYKKMNEDIKKGENIYTFNDSDEAINFLLQDEK